MTGRRECSHEHYKLVEVHLGVSIGVQVLEQFVHGVFVPSTLEETEGQGQRWGCLCGAWASAKPHRWAEGGKSEFVQPVLSAGSAPARASCAQQTRCSWKGRAHSEVASRPNECNAGEFLFYFCVSKGIVFGLYNAP